jgi:Flp pilus assembly secretin CpaC
MSISYRPTNFLATIAIVLASAGCSVATGAEAPKAMQLTKGFSEVVRPSRPARTIVVGDPKFVEATVGGGQSIVLTARNEGTTNLILLDEMGNEISRTTINVGQPNPNADRILIRSGHKGYKHYVCDPGCDLDLNARDIAPPMDSRSNSSSAG